MKQSSILFNRATCLNTYHVFEYQSEGIVRGCLERNAVAFEQQYCETINVSMGSVILPSWGSSKSAPTRSPTTATFQYPEVGFLLLVERLRLLFLTSCLLPLSQTTHTLRLTHPLRKYTQTHSHSDSTTLRFSLNEAYSQPVHSYSDSHTGSPTLRLTHSGHSHTEIPAHSAYSCSYSYTQGILRGSRQRYLHSQPDYSHSDSPNFKLTHTLSDSYSKQPILMWQA